jgi:hypothetical protein
MVEGTCTGYWGDEKCIQNFGQKTSKEIPHGKHGCQTQCLLRTALRRYNCSRDHMDGESHNQLSILIPSLRVTN